ncbi:hypothetical protein TDB9533_02696 [Thalassocella blandensis]|nr:hypothetical protein TDB9533_02696 [Thalassocella blandensis]
MHIHRSPGLTAIYNATRERSDLRVLDLGACTAGTFNFFSSNSGKIIFEDLKDFIEQHHTQPAEQFATALQEYCLPKNSDERFDIVLAWDLLNYLPFENTVALLSYIKPWCKQDTFIFTIKYPGGSVPKQPPQFEILDKHRVKVQKFSVAQRQYPGFTLSQFYKHSPDFQIENSISQHEGMLAGFAEQLIRYQPSLSQRNQLTTVAEMKPMNFREQMKETLRHYSPSLIRIKEQKDHRSILDLGVKSRGNLEVWRQSFGEVYFEDLASNLTHPQNTNAMQNYYSGISPNALQFNGKQFDVIMAWDLLNFCSSNQMEFIANRIRRLSHENTIISTLVYTGNRLPQKPSRFWLNEDYSLQIEAVTQAQRSTPRLTITGLMKTFGGARMIGTYAFEDGMNSDIREFLFTVPPLSEDANNPTSSQRLDVAN